MLHLSIKELNGHLAKGHISAVSLLTQTLRRLDLIQDLNVFVSVCGEDALKHAESSDNRLQRRDGDSQVLPLDGLTFAVKDNFCVKGVKTSCASKMLQNFIAPYSATVVDKSLQAGGVLIGKTNLDEFAMGSGTVDSCVGPTKNIWRSGIEYRLENRCTGEILTADTNRIAEDWVVAGGSSGGSAVAVASGAACLALGSDTGGSVRIPSAWCGVASLKPSYGALSRHGLVPLVNSMDVPGLMARSVSDIDTYFKVLLGRDDKDSTTVELNLSESLDIKNVKIGVPRQYFCDGMTSEVIESISEVCELFDNHGITTIPISLPHTDLAVPCYSVLNPCEVASNMARYDGLEFGLRGSDESSTEAMYADGRSLGFNQVVRGRILAGNYFLLKNNYEVYFEQALKIRRLILNDFLSGFGDVDFLVTPVTLSDAPSYTDFIQQDNRSQTARQDHCTQPVNLAGLPATTIPVKLSSKSLPLSVQLIGPYGSDLKLIKMAKWLEEKVNFPRLVINDI